MLISVTHLRTKGYFLIILSLELKLCNIQLVSFGLLWLQSQKMQLNNETVYDDGQRDENAENHHSIHQTEQQVGAVWGRSLGEEPVWINFDGGSVLHSPAGRALADILTLSLTDAS